MKRWSAVLISLVLAFALAGNAAAASKSKTVQVVLNGKPVAFQVDPVIIDNRTFVEFRTLFEQFGYDIEYDEAAKTITARSPMHKIQMAIGGDVAFVDGQTVEINGQLKIVNDRTMVGLRFLADLSGLEVDWDPDAFQASIVDHGPSAAELQAVFRVLDRMQKAETDSDADEMLRLFSDDSPLLDVLKNRLPEQFKKVQTKTTFVEKRIASYSKDQAVLLTTEDTVKVGGGFFADNVSDVKYTLVPGADGEWKIRQIEVLNAQYRNVGELFSQAVAVPDSVKSDLQNILNAQIEAMKKEDVDAYLATMTFENDEQKTAMKTQLQQLFAAADSGTSVEKWAVVDYDEAGKATLLFTLVSEVRIGTQTVKTRVVMTNGVEKIDGKWLFNTNGVQLSAEQL
jgi:hypothetical protein